MSGDPPWLYPSCNRRTDLVEWERGNRNLKRLDVERVDSSTNRRILPGTRSLGNIHTVHTNFPLVSGYKSSQLSLTIYLFQLSKIEQNRVNFSEMCMNLSPPNFCECITSVCSNAKNATILIECCGQKRSDYNMELQTGWFWLRYVLKIVQSVCKIWNGIYLLSHQPGYIN